MLVKNSNNSKLLYKDESNILINIVDIISVDLNLQRVTIVIFCESIYNTIIIAQVLVRV